jgi:hypothetical protein
LFSFFLLVVFTEGQGIVPYDPLLLPRENLRDRVIHAIFEHPMASVVRIVAPPASGKSSLITLVQQKLSVPSVVIGCLAFNPQSPEKWLLGKLTTNDPLQSIHTLNDLHATRRVIFLDDAFPLFEVKGFVDDLAKSYSAVKWVVATSYNAELVTNAASPYSVEKACFYFVWSCCRRPTTLIVDFVGL